MEKKIVVKTKKRRNAVIILLFLLFFFMLYFILEDISIYAIRERTVLFNQPNNITKEVTFEKTREVPTCENKKFRYSTEGGNVDSVDDSVRPNLKLYNLENKWGEFKVNFSFVDESEFPYEEFGGQRLFEKYESGEIRWEDGDFFSITYNIMMPPEEGVLIDDLTKKADKNKIYWAMANIIEPEYEYCYNKIERYNATENKTFTEYLQIEKKIKVNEYTKIFEVLHIESFGQWVIIVLMCFLILLLIGKIKDRYWIKKRVDKILRDEDEKNNSFN